MNDSDRFVRRWPGDGLPGFEDELTCWNAGFELLLELRVARCIAWDQPNRRPDTAAAETAISNFAKRLRRSVSELSLPRVQREHCVTGEGIVCVVYAMVCHWGMPHFKGSVREAALLACGLSPQGLRRLHGLVWRQEGFGRLFLYGRDGNIRPAPELLDAIDGFMSGGASLENRWVRSLPEAAPDPRAAPAQSDDNGIKDDSGDNGVSGDKENG